MSNVRFRRIIEIQYKEYRKIGGYFNRKHKKQAYKVWRRLRKLGVLNLTFSEFLWEVIAHGSRGITYNEMKMNNKALDKHFKNKKEGETE